MCIVFTEQSDVKTRTRNWSLKFESLYNRCVLFPGLHTRRGLGYTSEKVLNPFKSLGFFFDVSSDFRFAGDTLEIGRNNLKFLARPLLIISALHIINRRRKYKKNKR